MLKRVISFSAFIIFSLLLILFLFGYMPYIFKRDTYPKEYSNEVAKYSEEFGIDENFVYAVIKVESNFEPYAKSNAGAIGLMQIIEDSFNWVSRKLDEDTLVFEDMYIPENSIRYGCYMLSYLYDKYNSYELVAAAYHSGMTTVDGWILDGTVDPSEPDIGSFIGDNTRHYVKKIMRAFDKYSNN